MKVVAILPARMGASRFPGKPLHKILGIPMIGHCYFRTQMASGINETYVATCDQEIANYVSSIGGKVVMTSLKHNRASDRTAEAMNKIESESGEIDVIIMVQGDEPLILPENITATIHHFENPNVEVVNIMSRLHTRQQFEDKNNVKVVVNKDMDALYFSREPIPSLWKGMEHVPMYMQVGVIAFRRNALIRFNNTPETSLEKIESVDMNRVLETGGRIRMVLSDTITIGVDTPQEADAVASLLKNDPLYLEYSKA